GRHLHKDGKGVLPAFRVNRFWEKPSFAVAQALLGRGCLLNTFVMIGRARTFLDVIESAVPHVVKSFQAVADAAAGTDEAKCAVALYERLPDGDFSREVLTRYP